MTLVETLVVIALIAVLLGILLPAVQQVRSASSRAACLNNLKQIGLGLQVYHDARQVFPPGLTYQGGTDPQPFLSWLARILPYVEQTELWLQAEAAFQQDKDFGHNPPHAGALKVVKLFTCPADSRTARPSKYGPAFTAYLGVEGTNQYLADGVLFLDSRVRIADISDGTSATLLVGERPASADEKFGWWYAGWGQNRDGSAETVLGVREQLTFLEYMNQCSFRPPQFSSGNVNDPCSMLHFWSLHPGGAHFLFADGAARFIRYEAAPLMPALATRAGGEPGEQPD